MSYRFNRTQMCQVFQKSFENVCWIGATHLDRNEIVFAALFENSVPLHSEVGEGDTFCFVPKIEIDVISNIVSFMIFDNIFAEHVGEV